MQDWLERHERFHLHLTPTSSLWMNLVARYFEEITRDGIRNGSFGRVREQEKTTDQHIHRNNQAPTRFVWQAEGLALLEKRNRVKNKLQLPSHELSKPSEKEEEWSFRKA